MSDFVEYVALKKQIAVNENTLGRMETKLENLKQNLRNDQKKVRKYSKKLRKRAAIYELVVQRLENVIDNLLKLDKWKVASLEETEAAEKLDDEHDWKGEEIIWVPK